MRSVQTISAVAFFLGVHIPLSRIHSGFSFATAFLPVMLSLKTKYWFYEKANQLVCLVYRHDKFAKNVIKRPKHLQEHTEEVSLGDEIKDE